MRAKLHHRDVVSPPRWRCRGVRWPPRSGPGTGPGCRRTPVRRAPRRPRRCRGRRRRASSESASSTTSCTPLRRASRAAQHRSCVPALVQVGDQHDDGLPGWPRATARTPAPVDVGAAAELGPEQHVDRVARAARSGRRPRCRRRPAASLARRQRGERRRRDAEYTTLEAIEPLWSTARMTSAASDRRRRVADEPLRHDRVQLGLVVPQVRADRAVPVDVGERGGSFARCGRARRAPRALRSAAAARCPRRPAARPPRASGWGSGSARAATSAWPRGGRRAGPSRAPRVRAGAGAGRAGPSRPAAPPGPRSSGSRRRSPSQRATVGALPPSPPCREP